MYAFLNTGGLADVDFREVVTLIEFHGIGQCSAVRKEPWLDENNVIKRICSICIMQFFCANAMQTIKWFDKHKSRGVFEEMGN